MNSQGFRFTVQVALKTRPCRNKVSWTFLCNMALNKESTLIKLLLSQNGGMMQYINRWRAHSPYSHSNIFRMVQLQLNYFGQPIFYRNNRMSGEIQHEFNACLSNAPCITKLYTTNKELRWCCYLLCLTMLCPNRCHLQMHLSPVQIDKLRRCVAHKLRARSDQRSVERVVDLPSIAVTRDPRSQSGTCLVCYKWLRNVMCIYCWWEEYNLNIWGIF